MRPRVCSDPPPHAATTFGSATIFILDSGTSDSSSHCHLEQRSDELHLWPFPLAIRHVLSRYLLLERVDANFLRDLPDLPEAFSKIDVVKAFLKQGQDESSPLETTLAALRKSFG
jgi:hypothetical protein